MASYEYCIQILIGIDKNSLGQITDSMFGEMYAHLNKMYEINLINDLVF